MDLRRLPEHTAGRGLTRKPVDDPCRCQTASSERGGGKVDVIDEVLEAARELVVAAWATQQKPDPYGLFQG